MKTYIVNGVIILFALFSCEGIAAGADRYVDDSHTAGTFNGTGWLTSFQFVQDAVDIAASGDTIHVAQGTYRPDLDGGFNAPSHTLDSRFETIALKPGVIMLGGYIGYDNESPNTRDPALYPTILSGDMGTVGAHTDNSYHVVTANSATESPQTVLDGFVIERGNANGGGSLNSNGGGILIIGNESSPIVRNSLFQFNVASSLGGGVFTRETSGQVRFDDCVFDQNSAGFGGGGAYIYQSQQTTFSFCTFTSNFTSGTAANSGGGGLFLSTSLSFPQNIFLNDCQFISNYTAGGNGTGGGGAIMQSAGKSGVVARDCHFEENTANNGSGGAILMKTGGAANLVNCTFLKNYVDVVENVNTAGGGAVAFLDAIAPVTIVNCKFLNNSITGDSFGGGLYVNNGVRLGMAVTNCLFAGNQAARAGAAWVQHEGNNPEGYFPPNFTNCTIVNNIADASSQAGGLSLDDDDSAVIHNSILWGNTNPGGGGATAQLTWGGGSPEPVVSYSCVEGGASGTGNINVDPQFFGPTSGDVTARNYRLRPCSPASDAADYDVVPNDVADVNENSVTNESLPWDLDELARATDNLHRTDTGNDSVGDVTYIDMGTYEIVAPVCVLVGDVNDDSDIDALDIQPFVNCVVLGTGDNCICADFDINGLSNDADIECFVNLLVAGESCGITDCDIGQRSFPDCNENATHDANDIGDATSEDCNANGMPDECEIDEESSASGGPFFCTEDCAADINDNGVPDECEPDCNANGTPDAMDISESTSDDVNTNGIPDECELDCNSNGTPDAWDLSEETSADCNTNGIPDECDPDCNTNGVPDNCDVDPTDPDGDEWVSPDCNSNEHPDECDLSLPPPFGSLDCNDNDVPDACDIAECEGDPACDDCNENGVPDGCDIAAEISEDLDTNGIPDECESEMLMSGGDGNRNPLSYGRGSDQNDSQRSSAIESPGMSAEESEAAAWEAFYEWALAQCWGNDCEATGAEQFQALMDKLSELELSMEGMLP